MQTSIENQLNLAKKYYEAGSLAEAESMCRQVVQQEPHQVKALFWLALIADQMGKTAESVDYYTTVLDVQPDLAEAHGNLGSVLLKQRRLEEAIAHHRQSVVLMPESAQAHYNLAVALSCDNKIEDAIEHYQKALSLMPDYVVAHHNLGIAFCQQKKFEAGIYHYKRVIELEPNHASAYFSLGEALYQQKKLEDAIAHYRQAIAIQPEDYVAHNSLGVALKQQAQFEQAIDHFQQAIALEPHYVEAYVNLAATMRELYRNDEAIAYCQAALRLAPTNATVHNAYACILYSQEKFEAAIASFEESLRHDPDCAEVHSNLGMVLLHSGNFQRGFAEYFWRLKVHPTRLRYEEALWNGADLHGKTILLTAEQGFGDQIQFARYATLLAKQGGEVVIGCPKQMVCLLATVPGVSRCVDSNKDSVETHFHAPLLELPRILGTTLDTIPATVPYVSPPTDSTIHLNTPPNTHLRVGMVWNPNPASPTFRKRSCPLSHLLDLLKISGIALYSLQKNVSDSDAELLQSYASVQALGEYFTDFADTAAAIAQLDLVISIDTSVAHLAGALGKPTWLLLPKCPDWRWLIDRDDSPWYPTMRLFRQQQLGDWNDVFIRVAAALKTFKA